MSEVFKIKRHLDGKVYAVKQLPFKINQSMSDVQKEYVLREVQILSQLQHPFIVEFVDWF